MDRRRTLTLLVVLTIVVVVFGSMGYAMATQNYTLLFWSVIAMFLVFSVGRIAVGLVKERLAKS